MINILFDPVTTQLIIGRKKSANGGGGNSVAKMSSLYIPNSLELQTNSILVENYVELTDSGSFIIAEASTVEVI